MRERELILFEDCPEAMDILNSGKSLTTFFIFDKNGPYKDYEDYYYDILGYTIPKEGDNELHIATVLSEIGNMPGHFVVVGAHHKVVTGLHGDMFYVDLEEMEDLEEII